MLNLRKVLVPTDLSPSARRATDLATVVAKAEGAELHLLHVSAHPEKGPLEEFFAFLFNHPRQQKRRERIVLSRLEEAMRSHLGEWQPIIRHIERPGSDPATEIISYAQEIDVDLIVMGTHGHRSFEHALGGTTGEVMRRSARPVLTVRDFAGVTEIDPEMALKRIVVPVDFSEQSRQAVRVADRIAKRFGSTVNLLFVAEERQIPVFSDTGIPTLNTLRMDPEIIETSEQALRQLYRQTSGSDDVETAVRSGHPAREILAHAHAERADLLVMSTHGRADEEAVTLGSITEKVARRATCPVLVLQPSGRSLTSS